MNLAGAPAELPLVTISIPAYSARFLRPALDSAVGQTWPNCEIFVSQDGDDQDIPRICADYPKVTLVAGPNRGMRANFEACLLIGSGTYIKMLLDDDLLAPDCVRRMAEVFEGPRGHEITLVTSRRWLIDAEERPLRLGGGLPGVTNDGIVPRNSMWRLVIERLHNFVGELSTVMIRRADFLRLGPKPMERLGIASTGLFDLRLFLDLNRLGALYLFAEPLSAFRQHPWQNSVSPNAPHYFALRQEAWLNLIEVAASAGLIDPACQQRGTAKVEALVLSLIAENPALVNLLVRVRRRLDVLAAFAPAAPPVRDEIPMAKAGPLD